MGAGMNGRGAVEIIVAGIGLEAGVIDLTLFTVLVFTAIATTATVPPLLTWGVRWLRTSGDLPEAPVRTGVVIVGGNALGLLLARNLADHRPVSVVDTNPAHTHAAAEAGLEAVTGDALDQDTLAEASTGTAAAVVALTANPEVNVLAARRALDVFHVEHAVAAVGTSSGGLRTVAADHGVLPLSASSTDSERWDHRVAAGTATARWHTLAEPTPDLEARGHLPLLVDRNGQRHLYATATPLVPGDRVLTVADDRDHAALEDAAAVAG